MMSLFEAAQRNTPHSRQVEVIEREQYLARKRSLVNVGLPYVVRSYAPELSPETAKEILIQVLGDVSVKARRNASAAKYATSRDYADFGLFDYLETIFSSDPNFPYYAANCPIKLSTLSALGIESPLLLHGYSFRDPNLWIGAAGNTTPLHKDSTDNFAVHLTGKKKWSLFSILDSDAMYYARTPYGSYTNPLAGFAVSQVDLTNVDEEAFPLFRQAQQVDVVCEAGDLLYLPYGWAHAVENLTPAIMINLWFSLDEYRPLILCSDGLES